MHATVTTRYDVEYRDQTGKTDEKGKASETLVWRATVTDTWPAPLLGDTYLTEFGPATGISSSLTGTGSWFETQSYPNVLCHGNYVTTYTQRQGTWDYKLGAPPSWMPPFPTVGFVAINIKTGTYYLAPPLPKLWHSLAGKYHFQNTGGDTNLYAYAGNDPVNRTDRRGAEDPLAPLVPDDPPDPLAPLVPADPPPLAPLVPPERPKPLCSSNKKKTAPKKPGRWVRQSKGHWVLTR